MPSSRISALEGLAAALARGAALELYLTPKPGLVDRADRGSHPDLSLATMERSLAIVADTLQAIVRSLAAGEDFARQAAIGRAAEGRMFEELGTNTHKGYIFLAGMLLIARWHAPGPDEAALRRTLGALATRFFATRRETASHGHLARQCYGAGGIMAEATAGLPAVFEQALPLFRHRRRQGASCTVASFAMLGRLMQTVDDTTTLHRGGPAGLARLRRDGRRLESLIASGGDWLPFLHATNRAYVGANLTMGGVADLLAIAYGCLIAGGEMAADAITRKRPAEEALPA